MKIKVNNKLIDLPEGTTGLYGSVQVMGSAHSGVARRDVLKIDFPFGRAEYDKIGWQDFMQWSLVDEIPQESGEPIINEYDKSEYYLICDIIERQDTNNVTVYMGKPTDTELLESTINDLLEV